MEYSLVKTKTASSKGRALVKTNWVTPGPEHVSFDTSIPTVVEDGDCSITWNV